MAAHAGPPGPSNYYHCPYGNVATAPFPGQYQRYQAAVPMNGHIHRPIFHPHYNYHHPHQPAHYVPRSSYWQQHGQQPLSPLPKQLSTLPSLQSSGDQIGNQNIEPEETPNPTPSPPSPMPSPDPKLGGWVIWSKRPTDPSTAPGIIISPLAHPPRDVIQYALDIPTPPPSPTPVIIDLSAPTVPSDLPDSTESNTTPPLSTAFDTPVPGSPDSTNTSLSLAKAPEQPEEKPWEEATSSNAELEPELSSTDHVEAPKLSESDTEPFTSAAAPSLSDAEPSAANPSDVDSSTSTPSAEASTSAPKPAPAPAPKPAVSWASLLRKPGPSNLPASSVVGFSIPASPPPPPNHTSQKTPSHPKKSELLTLLNSGGSSAAPMRIRPRGLVNSGNLCFANAVLQVLVYCPPFWRFFTDLGRLLEPTEESKTPLVDATIRFIREFMPKERVPVEGKGKGVERYGSNGLVHEEVNEDIMDSFMPTYVHDALKEKKRFDHMRGGHQEDAEEFLGFYLDTLEEELLTLSSSLANPNPVPAQQNHNAAVNNTQEEGWLEVGKRNRTVLTRSTKTADSPMTRIFGGKFRSILRVPHQKDSAVVEDWRSLRLDIQRDTIHTIKDALTHISTPQSVQVTSVTRPGATLDAIQQVYIESLPPILILHLKRFLYDANKGGVAKVGKQVAFAPELEVGSEVMAPGRKVNGTRYRLFGALYHHGLSASGGHYTLDVLHPNVDMSTPPTKPREGWIRIDDELVSDLRADDVFGTGGAEKDETMRCAYLLFYRRVGAGKV
ncbi:cysteine proteinase [Suillus hirtellus]|nr:cysteine proteinase [Suillus hirtellus]